MVRQGKFLMVIFLFILFSGVVFGQDKETDAEKDKNLRDEILAVYKAKGEEGLQDFVKDKKDSINNKLIVGFAESGVKERKEEWLKISLTLAEEIKDEKCLADVYIETGNYFIFISDFKKALDYIEKALPIYLKINDPVGQGNVYLGKGNIYLNTGDYTRALDLYDKSLIFFEKKDDPIGQGNVYLNKGIILYYTGDAH